MSTSLKAFLPALSKPFGLTPIALYGRQLSLERVGLLGARTGKGGPGSGIRLTAETAAMMLIALLATDSVDAAESAAKVAKLKNTGGKCPFTGKTTFGDALATILASESLRERARFINVNRAVPVAGIVYLGKGAPLASAFAPRGKPSALTPPVKIEAAISPEAFRSIATAVGQALK